MKYDDSGERETHTKGYGPFVCEITLYNETRLKLGRKERERKGEREQGTNPHI